MADGAVVEALQAMRGVGLIVAVIMAAEVGDVSGIDKARQRWLLGRPIGVCERRTVRRGDIPRQGTPLPGACDRRSVDLSHAGARQPKLHDRNEKLPQAIRDVGWKAQVRLCAVIAARGGRQGEGRRCHRDRAKWWAFCGRSLVWSNSAQQPDGCKAVITAPKAGGGAR